MDYHRYRYAGYSQRPEIAPDGYEPYQRGWDLYDEFAAAAGDLYRRCAVGVLSLLGLLGLLSLLGWLVWRNSLRLLLAEISRAKGLLRYGIAGGM